MAIGNLVCCLLIIIAGISVAWCSTENEKTEKTLNIIGYVIGAIIVLLWLFSIILWLLAISGNKNVVSDYSHIETNQIVEYFGERKNGEITEYIKLDNRDTRSFSYSMLRVNDENFQNCYVYNQPYRRYLKKFPYLYSRPRIGGCVYVSQEVYDSFYKWDYNIERFGL